jgi:fermentation-respiration switch protein FrsA (DUF1100 family)
VTEPLEVAIPSDGLELAGHLRVPPGGVRPGPALVFTGPLTGVKEQVTGTYATALAERGYVTLAFDHRNFGASGGLPRQHEDPPGKLADLRDALSWLVARPEVDEHRLGCVGVCLGGGYALRFSAFDPRVRALATVAGGYNDPAAMRAGMGATGYRDLLADLRKAAVRQYATGDVEYMAAVAPDGSAALMAGDEPYAYYGTDRSSSPGWVNQITRTSLYELLTVDLARGAGFISPTPWLMVHGRTDPYCSPEGAQAAFDRAGEPKRLLWLDTTNHIDLYDEPKCVDPAVDAVAAWFDEHL